MNVIAIRNRVRDFDRPPTHQQLQSIVLIGAAVVISAPFIVQIPKAGNPAVALGISMQTLAGLVVAVRLWANVTADAAVAWMARQIGRGRRRIMGLLDGRLLSMCLAAGFYLAANLTAKTLWLLAPVGGVGWAIAVPALALFAFGAIVFVLSMFMLLGSILAPQNPLPDGEAATGAQARLAASRWVWPVLALVVVIGGLLQVFGS